MERSEIVPTTNDIGVFRRDRRVDRVEAALNVRFGVDALEHSARSTNISEDGIHLATNVVLEIGQRVQLAIEFGEYTSRQTGEVIWAIQVPEHLTDAMVYGMGIRFVDPDPGWSSVFRQWSEAWRAPD